MRLGTLKGEAAAHSLGVGAVVGVELFFCLQLKSFYGKGQWESQNVGVVRCLLDS